MKPAPYNPSSLTSVLKHMSDSRAKKSAKTTKPQPKDKGKCK